MSGDSPDARGQTALEALFYHTDTIRFIYWEQFAGAKPTVLLTGAIAIVAFVTGLSNLSHPGLPVDGPIAGFLPGAEAYATFAGVSLSFVLGVITVFLQRRKLVAWYGAIVVLPLLVLLPLTTFQTTDIPLLILVLIAWPLLVWNRDRFDQPFGFSGIQIASMSSIIGVIAYGAVGAWALRDEFLELNSISDSVYYVIVTIATVGYGDITPLSAEAKWFSLSVILFGTGAFTAAIGALVVPAIESRMAAAFGNMTASELNLLEDHVLVLGYGDITESLLEELGDEVDVVVVTEDTSVASHLTEDSINVLTDDPTDEAVLTDARIDAARGVVVATEDDARDVLAVLAARETNPDIRIVAAANVPTNVSKLERVGADRVISPMAIAGQLLGRSLLGETTGTSIAEEVENLATGGGDGDSGKDSTGAGPTDGASFEP